MPVLLRFICFGLAALAFLVASFGDVRAVRGRSVSLVAVGLFLFAVPFAWDVAEAL